MRNLTISFAALLCLCLTKSFAQDNSNQNDRKPTFESRAKEIANTIERITKEEKEALKLEVEAVNMQLENGSITNQQADEKKLALADSRAKSIEYRVAQSEKELRELVQQKVDGKIGEQDSVNHKFLISWDAKNNYKNKQDNGELRTTSQFVLAAGFNNLVTNGSVANSDYGYLRSKFFEWGFAKNTRILKNNNLLHLKYALTFVYNDLHITDNRLFDDAGEQTVLTPFPEYLRKKDTYFKNVFVTLPVHIEFDFGKKEVKNDKTIFRVQKGFRLGLGGFVGYNTNSKQFLSYKVDGYRYNTRQKGNFNIEDWNYGVSAYIGYRETSVYVKYDINPMFKNNTIDQNNISAGLRFDFN